MDTLSNGWLIALKILLFILLACLVVGALQRQEVRQVTEEFVSAYTEEPEDDRCTTCTVSDKKKNSATISIDEGKEEDTFYKCKKTKAAKRKKGKGKKGKYDYDVPKWTSPKCLPTYEDKATGPVFLEDTWAVPDAPMHVGTLLPTFHFEESQGFD